MKDKITNGYVLTQLSHRRTGGREHSLHPLIKLAEINKRIGRSKLNMQDGDGKVTREWHVKAKRLSDGRITTFSIWDYKGSRWSAAGDIEALQAIFGAKAAVSSDSGTCFHADHSFYEPLVPLVLAPIQ